MIVAKQAFPAWIETEDFDSVSPNANFEPTPNEVTEGWLKLTKKENK